VDWVVVRALPKAKLDFIHVFERSHLGHWQIQKPESGGEDVVSVVV